MHSCIIPNLSAALFRRRCFVEHGVLSTEYKVCCDWELFFRLAHVYDFYYLAEPLNYFRQHATTIRSTTKDRIIYEEYFRLLFGQLNWWDFLEDEKELFKIQIGQIWASHLFQTPANGIRNFFFLLRTAKRYDSHSLGYLRKGILRTVNGKMRQLLSREA